MYASSTTWKRIRPTETSMYSSWHAHTTHRYTDRRARQKSLCYCLQPPRRAISKNASVILDNMTQLPHLRRFCSQFMCQLEALQKQMDAELATAQQRYECSFDGAVWDTIQFCSTQCVFFDRPSVKMIKSVHMANRLLTKLPPQTFSRIKYFRNAGDRHRAWEMNSQHRLRRYRLPPISC